MAWEAGGKEVVAPYAVELRHLGKRVLPEKESAEYVEDEPPPRARLGTTAQTARQYTRYPEQTLTAEETESGVKVPDLSETIGEGIRKTKVVMEDGRTGYFKHGRGAETGGSNGAGDGGNVPTGV
jgi:hypothetical protein